MKNIILKVNGMSCTNCAKGIQKNLEKNNITEVNVNFSTSEVSFIAKDDNDINKAKYLIKKMGYVIYDEKIKQKLKISKLEKYFYTSLFFTIPLFLHMFLPKENILHNPVIQFFLCLPVFIIGLKYFGKSAWNSIKMKFPNMDVLIFIGSTSAFLYSLIGWIIFNNTSQVYNYMFFETCATIITLVLLGNLLEHNSIKKTTSSISDLTKMQHTIAKREVDGLVEEIKIDETKVNDILIVNTGDIVPIDGKIIEGSCSVDESMITGESLPISKNIDDNVIGGTIITNGNIKIKVINEKEDTVLSKIILLIKDAQKSKPKIQRTGDKISAIFVPVVITISILTLILGYYFFNLTFQEALLRSIAVLVISCPCAMGLATPTAVMVGVGIAAKNGILIKGGDTLEKLAEIKTIAFDKTGTLTNGNFEIEKLVVNGTENESEIKNIIYNLEKHSSHPIAKSLCKIYKKFATNLEASKIIEKKGKSIIGTINNQKYEIGSSKIKDTKDDFDVYLYREEKLIAKLKIYDQIKHRTKETIENINLKYNTILVSGDSRRKCKNISKKLNIKEIYSEQTPIDKIDIIDKLAQKSPTIMVGDGINDAPALEKATIGISLSDSTQIAIKSADIVLLNKNTIEKLPLTLDIGKHTLLTIKQNLFWAFSYNIIAIPLAILGLLNPMWAALFMAFSDIVVIGNSIRLRYKNIFS